jgi:hypothetical protein
MSTRTQMLAALNYHSTMLKHGARSEIALIEEEEARCYCIGSSSEPAASGSPTLEYLLTE